jgi:ubiquinone/menaquinone biosynthesis C-methylase UbiE
MNAALQLRVQRYGWDRAADSYEASWSRQLRPAQDLLLEMAALEPGQSVLDVACGTGLVTFPAADKVGPDGAVLATDISQRMVDTVAERARALGLTNVQSKRLDAEDSAVGHGRFDVALCSLGLMYAPDPVAGLRVMNRSLRMGGRAISAVWGQRSRCGWADIFPIVDARVRTDVCPMFFHLGTGETLALAYETAGFREIEVRRIDTILEYETLENAVEAAFAGGPVAMAYSRFDDETRQAAESEYADSISPFKNGQGYRIPGEFVVASGRRL